MYIALNIVKALVSDAVNKTAKDGKELNRAQNMLHTTSSTYCISSANTSAESCTIYLDGKPAALMRIVSKTPHALNC
jgi:hypothetical protein